MMWLHDHAHGWSLRIAGGAIWSILAVCGAYAQVIVAGYETGGTGATEREAIRNALQQAAFQLCGVRLQSETSSNVTFVASGDTVEIIEGINQQISVTTGKEACRLEGYDVLGVARDGDDVRVRIAVRHATYRTPGPAVERRRLAVLDFEIDEVHLYGAGGGREQRSGGRVARRGVDVDFDLIRNLQERFRARIEELLTQGRRFAVLDRRAPGLYEEEKRLLRSADVDPAEAARLGNVLGADYLLYGTVDRIAVEEQRTQIRLTGESHARVFASMRVRFSVLAVATRQVKWSSSIALEQETEEDHWPEHLAEALLDETAGYLVDELTENIYPPVVVQLVVPGSFVVNRGGSTVQAGDLFEVFATGPPIIDPDTGESLGSLEIAVGVAQVTEVKPKYSLAKMITGTTGVAKDMVLRRYRGELATLPVAGGTSPMLDSSGRERNYRSAEGDGDGDGMPDYLNRDAQTGDRDKDGLPDYLNRDNLRRR